MRPPHEGPLHHPWLPEEPGRFRLMLGMLAGRPPDRRARRGRRVPGGQYVRLHRPRPRGVGQHHPRPGQAEGGGRARALIVTGCLTQRYGQDILIEIPEVSAILGTSELDRIVDLVNQADGRQNWVTAAPPGYLYDAATAPSQHARALCLREDRRGLRHGVYVLRDPAVPGPSPQPPHPGRGRRGEGARRTRDQGHPRVPGHAGLRPRLAGNGDIADLLLALSDTAMPWIRPMYLHPAHVNDRLVTRWARARVVPYLDMPVQHGDDGVLRAMRRAVTTRRMKEIVAQFREAIPGVTVRTTVLVGFPGRRRPPSTISWLHRGRGLRPAGRLHLLHRGGHARRDHGRSGPCGDHDRAGGAGGGDTRSAGVAAPEGALRHQPNGPGGRARPRPRLSLRGATGRPGPEIDGVVLLRDKRLTRAASRRSASSKWTATSSSRVTRPRRATRRSYHGRAGSTASHSRSPPAAPATLRWPPAPWGAPLPSSCCGSSVHAHGARLDHARRHPAGHLVGRTSSAPSARRIRHHRDRRGRRHGAVILFLPRTIPVLLVAFFLFRLFDVWKPFPAREPGPHRRTGVMVDDLIAGVYAPRVRHGRPRIRGARMTGVRILTVGVAEARRARRCRRARGGARPPCRRRASGVARGGGRGRGRAGGRARAALDGGGVVVVLAPPGGSAGDIVRRVLARLAGVRLVLSDRLLDLLDADFARRGRALPVGSSAWPSCRKAPSSGRRLRATGPPAGPWRRAARWWRCCRSTRPISARSSSSISGPQRATVPGRVASPS